MIEFLREGKIFWKNQGGSNSLGKIILTLGLLFLFRLGNTIPLPGIDSEALSRSLFQLKDSAAIMQIINIYSGGGGKTILSSFSLGIIPFINASILVDLLSAIIPSLEKLQSEEGESGRQKLKFYKKILTLFFAILQSSFLINYLRPYLYDSSLSFLVTLVMQLVSGSMVIVWLSDLIDNRGIGNGTSVIIFTNIVVSIINKNIFDEQIDTIFFVQIVFLLFITLLICISQTARLNIEVISARQLAYKENKPGAQTNLFNQKFFDNDKGLFIRINQAGIFPIIIASNISPVFNSIENFIFQGRGSFLSNGVLYYLFIIGFNYLYTTLFWDPEKISEQLRKASVSIVNITPGNETISYLENMIRSASIIGGGLLCTILLLYDTVRKGIYSPILNQINVSSLIIVVGAAYELQKTIRSLYKNIS